MKKQTNRLNFIKGTGIGLAGSVLLLNSCVDKSESVVSGSAILSQKKYKWNMVTTWPPNFPILGESCAMLAEWVEKMSGGRLKIRVYGGGELIPALETFDAVSSGTAEIGSGASYYWAGKAPAAQFFASVPFGINAQQMNTWLLAGDGMKLWEELYSNFNLVPMLAGNTGVQMAGWFNRKIESIEDFKGLKMRMPGLGGKVLTTAGGAAILSPGSEIYTNLERGVIDATEWIGPYHDYLMGFHKIAKYYYSPGWHETGTTLEIIVNKQKLEKLPLDLQEILKAGVARQNSWVLAQFEYMNSVYLQKLKEEGVNVSLIPKEVLAELKKIASNVLEEEAAKDPMSQKVYSSFKSFKKGISQWAEITEKSFFQL